MNEISKAAPDQRQRSNRLVIYLAIIAVAAFAGLAVILSSIASHNHLQALAAQRSVELAEKVLNFEHTMGYGGFIHNFKNFVLRPSEMRYQDGAKDQLEKALAILRDLERIGESAGAPIMVAEARQTLRQYGEMLEVARLKPPNDSSARALDAKIRVDDSGAIADINMLVEQARANLSAEIEGLEVNVHTLQIVSGMLTLVILGALLMIYLHDRRQREAAFLKIRRQNNDLEDFTQIAAHDLRSPLRALSILPNWIRRDLDRSGGLSLAVDEHLNDMRTQVQRMDRLLSDLLAYSQVGREAASEEMIDPGLVVEEVRQLLRPPPSYHIVVEGNLPLVDAIPAEFELVLRNLISNAVKHHDRDRGRIVVRGGQAGGQTFFEVRDDGPGIPPDYHETIFDMFSTLRSRDDVEGSGMGLTLVKKIVERWGGRVSISSTERERGTTFRFTMPATAHAVAA